MTIGWLILIHLVLQVADGVLTGLGVARFGIKEEGNPLVVWLISYLGLVGGLVAAKGIGIAWGVSLFRSNNRLALVVLNWLLLLVAVIPWILVLCFHKAAS